jgi:hypothetical protein
MLRLGESGSNAVVSAFPPQVQRILRQADDSSKQPATASSTNGRCLRAPGNTVVPFFCLGRMQRLNLRNGLMVKAGEVTTSPDITHPGVAEKIALC